MQETAAGKDFRHKVCVSNHVFADVCTEFCMWGIVICSQHFLFIALTKSHWPIYDKYAGDNIWILMGSDNGILHLRITGFVNITLVYECFPSSGE